MSDQELLNSVYLRSAVEFLEAAGWVIERGNFTFKALRPQRNWEFLTGEELQAEALVIGWDPMGEPHA